jgi:hypothetical protein
VIGEEKRREEKRREEQSRPALLQLLELLGLATCPS